MNTYFGIVYKNKLIKMKKTYYPEHHRPPQTKTLSPLKRTTIAALPPHA